MVSPPPFRRRDRKRRDLDARPASRQGQLGEEWIEFRPARWLVGAVALVGLFLARPRPGKRALLAFAWRFTPRRLKLIAGGAAGLTLIVLVVSVAVLIIALNQLA